jgi:hypothetical protein
MVQVKYSAIPVVRGPNMVRPPVPWLADPGDGASRSSSSKLSSSKPKSKRLNIPRAVMVIIELILHASKGEDIRLNDFGLRIFDIEFIKLRRVFGQDYEEGSGPDLFKFDATTHGPILNVNFNR